MVCISDTHNVANQIPLPPGDILVHAGDFTGHGRKNEVEIFAQYMRAQQQFAHRVVIAGNHELCLQQHLDEARKMLDPVCTFLHESGAIVAGLSFWGSPVYANHRVGPFD